MMEVTGLDPVSNMRLSKELYLLFVNIRSIYFPCELFKHVGYVIILIKAYYRNNDCVAVSDTSILRSPNINMFPIDIV